MQRRNISKSSICIKKKFLTSKIQQSSSLGLNCLANKRSTNRRQSQLRLPYSERGNKKIIIIKSKWGKRFCKHKLNFCTYNRFYFSLFFIFTFNFDLLFCLSSRRRDNFRLDTDEAINLKVSYLSFNKMELTFFFFQFIFEIETHCFKKWINGTGRSPSCDVIVWYFKNGEIPWLFKATVIERAALSATGVTDFPPNGS